MTSDANISLRKTSSLTLIAFLWIILALASIIPAMILLQASLPVFTILWLVVPLFALINTRRVEAVGIRAVHGRVLLRYTAMNMALLGLLMLLVEPWSHTYQSLLIMAIASPAPDMTFAWLARYPIIPGLLGMLLISGLVTLFGEELFFRGWLLQIFLRRMRPAFAIALQAALFTIPQALAALLMAPLQAMLYVAVYSFLAIGCLGGWAAWKTQSIWPSLISATILNLVFVVIFVVF